MSRPQGFSAAEKRARPRWCRECDEPAQATTFRADGTMVHRSCRCWTGYYRARLATPPDGDAVLAWTHGEAVTVDGRRISRSVSELGVWTYVLLGIPYGSLDEALAARPGDMYRARNIIE